MGLLISIALIGFYALFLAVATLFSIRSEKKRFNNGKCPVCGKKLYIVARDSQGGRHYSCDELHYDVWISYPCVDKEVQNG